jgi:hypothetical protein
MTTTSPPVRIVCATPLDEDAFFQTSFLGRSLKALRGLGNVQIALFANNRLGLPVVYNSAIAAAAAQPALLAFVHDDVMLCDFFWAAAVQAGLNLFDVIGLAGGRVRVPNQPSWSASGARGSSSGVVGQGEAFPPEGLHVFGPPALPVKLLDGLFLAASSETLLARQVRFDDRFKFHFYDLDFCRTAESRGLTMGTWPISALHRSQGDFWSPAWKEGYARYLEKWGD